MAMPSTITDIENTRSSAMPVSGPVLRRTLWREWRGSLLTFAFVSIYLELCLHLCIFRSINIRILYPILFALMEALICSLVASSLPKIPGRIMAVALTLLQTVLAEVQLVYNSIFGSLMPISQVQMGGDVVTNFGQQILYGIQKNILPILLLLVPLIVLVLTLILRKAPRYRLRWRQALCSFGILLVLIVLTAGLMVTGKGEPFSVYEIFTNVNTSTEMSYKNVGMLATTEQELRYMLLGVGQDQGMLNEVSLGTTKEPETYSSREYNVIEDIDFQKLRESTDDPNLQRLDEYFSTVLPTRKNDYTGLLKDYNLITICAESFSPWLISEELTPMLYEMSHTGILFENYYGSFQSVTTNGEYTMCMGLYPDMSRTKTDSSFDQSKSNDLPFCLGNALRAEGYSTWAYHNYIGDFYNRNLTHPNMGYTFKSADNGLNITVDWPSSDLEMIEASIDDYIDSEGPFHAYYMTFSGHYQYNWHNAMSAKNRAQVESLPYSMPVKAFIACNLELEYALEYLVDRLKEEGILDKTCIVLTNDHYPYGLSEQEYNELAGQPLDTTFEKYRNSFICYAPGLKENIEVEEYCSTADILPTLLNLMGAEYDSRLLAGTDVFSSGPHIAVLAEESFLTDRFRYDAGTETLTAADETDEVDMDTLNMYRMYVDNKFQISADILQNDYYGHVFDHRKNDVADAETVVFEDITNIFYQAGVSYMYRNGYVEPESETVFGGKYVTTLGEFCDVLYRIAGCPETSNEFLPKGYENSRFNSTDYEYYDAVCWAFETGLVRDGDKQDNFHDRVDYRTASLLMYRYAQLSGVATDVEEAELLQAAEDYPEIGEEELPALVWCYEESFLTGSVGELEQILDRFDRRISRAQMATFLFRLCTYKLDLNET